MNAKKTEKKLYRVSVTWRDSGDYYVRAASAEEQDSDTSMGLVLLALSSLVLGQGRS